ncbi:MAG: SsrA-binding protein SmpB [Pirellulales bacterium]|nr:SsrA-binding protein SmpB [Pirellulales bacterium]
MRSSFFAPRNPHREDRLSKNKSRKKAPKQEDDGRKIVARNRRARHEYEILETLECGLMLVGSEVKSLRTGKLSLDEAYGRVKNGEVWLIGSDIPEYVEANRFNHDPRRPRKLLMHRREVNKFANRALQDGLTLIPLSLYFNREGRAKVLMGIGRGRKLHDKRENLKAKEARREIDRAARRGR